MIAYCPYCGLKLDPIERDSSGFAGWNCEPCNKYFEDGDVVEFAQELG